MDIKEPKIPQKVVADLNNFYDKGESNQQQLFEIIYKKDDNDSFQKNYYQERVESIPKYPYYSDVSTLAWLATWRSTVK